MRQKHYRIKVRLRKGSYLWSEPLYDTHVYRGFSCADAKQQMYKRIYDKYKCFNPEVISCIELWY